MVARASKQDPYRTFKFRVRLDSRTVAGITKVSALGRTVTANEIKEAGDSLAPRQNPSQVSYDDVTLEWGMSLDRTFESWANAVPASLDDPARVRHFKRTAHIDVYDLDGNPTAKESAPVISYRLHKAWVSRFVAVPDLDAASGAVGIQSMVLKHEGWERVK